MIIYVPIPYGRCSHSSINMGVLKWVIVERNSGPSQHFHPCYAQSTTRKYVDSVDTLYLGQFVVICKRKKLQADTSALRALRNWIKSSLQLSVIYPKNIKIKDLQMVHDLPGKVLILKLMVDKWLSIKACWMNKHFMWMPSMEIQWCALNRIAINIWRCRFLPKEDHDLNILQCIFLLFACHNLYLDVSTRAHSLGLHSIQSTQSTKVHLLHFPCQVIDWIKSQSR